jgi:hypothetical protein
MKHWYKEYLKKQGVTFSSYEEERAYVQKHQEEARGLRIQEHMQRIGACDQARYQQRVFDGQSEAIARQRNREFDVQAQQIGAEKSEEPASAEDLEALQKRFQKRRGN